MITSFGKFLRIMRVQRDEQLKDMARKLGVTPAYLGCIENGIRVPTRNLISRLEKEYNLSPTESDELYFAFYDTVKEVNIDISLASSKQMDLCIMFAIKFKKLDNEAIQKISKILEE